MIAADEVIVRERGPTAFPIQAQSAGNIRNARRTIL